MALVGGGFVFVALGMGILGSVPEEFSGAASGQLQAMRQIAENPIHGL
ncbi:hypothetical protein [Actinacidiphila oryziradicis]|nr:hypothetical protein [Actinacidiphila oryziradicis]